MIGMPMWLRCKMDELAKERMKFQLDGGQLPFVAELAYACIVKGFEKCWELLKDREEAYLAERTEMVEREVKMQAKLAKAIEQRDYWSKLYSEDAGVNDDVITRQQMDHEEIEAVK